MKKYLYMYNNINIFIQQLCICLSLFFLPISSTIKSIFIFLYLSLLIFYFIFNLSYFPLKIERLYIICILFFIFIVIACIWSPANLYEKIFVLHKYDKIILLPLLSIGFRNKKTRFIGIHCFLLSILLVCILSITKYYGYLKYFHFNSDYIFRNHIITGIMIALSSYLSLLLLYKNYDKKFRYIYIPIFLINSYQIFFINLGRTGYIIYVISILTLIIQIFSISRKMIYYLFLLTFVFSFSYLYSPIMKNRIVEAYSNIEQYIQHKNLNTSIGFRIQFHKYAINLFIKHPILGNGTASFMHYYNIEKPIKNWSKILFEPHSQYWLTVSEHGIFGLLLLLILFISLISESSILVETKEIFITVIIIFIFGNISDSLIFYSGSGYLFILFLSLCLGEKYDTSLSY